ncbi:MAG: metal ABC transporter ATP-binding protein [Proteobacteria bacterium]|jgi:zinc/manganese transport system ATP-binding protein|nr:metal ABC transporter ATP-binding protein [Pseudomonadota bacterium]
MMEVHHLTLCYRDRAAVHSLSGRFETGSHTAIVGPNGAGKSTLLSALAGIKTPDEGHIHAHGKVAYLAQLSTLDKQFPLMVRELALAGAWSRRGAWRGLSKQDREQADSALEQVGLSDFANAPISNLSGGQLQRARFARLIVEDADVLLLDEPFANVDSSTIDKLLEVQHHWHQMGKTQITVLHDISQVRAHYPQTLLLAQSAIAWGNTPDVLTESLLAEANRRAQHWRNDAAWCEVCE